MNKSKILQPDITGLFGAVAFVAIILSGSLIYHYGSDLQRRLSMVENDHGNAIGWAASQVEVDLLLLTQTASDVRRSTAEILDLKQRFRAFHSRLKQTQAGLMKRELGSDEIYLQATGKLLETTDKLSQMLSLSDAQIIESLPVFLEYLVAARPEAHNVALAALRVNADKDTVAQIRARDSLKQRKIAQWIVIAVETLTLIVLALFLFRLRSTANKTGEYAAGIEAILSASPFPAVLINKEGLILEANVTAIEAMCGDADASEFQYDMHLFSDCVEAGGARSEFRHFVTDLFSRKDKTGGQSVLETTLRNGNGENFPAELTAERVLFHDEEAIAIFVRDIEAQLAAQDELVRARDAAMDANNMKARFLKMVSHESRTPLQGLYSSIEILRTTENKRSHARALDIAESSVEVLSRHVEDILSFVENNAPSLSKVEEVFSVDALLTDLKGIFLDSIKSSKCRVRFINEAKNLSVKGDRGRIRQALICLVNNAFKNTKTGSIEIGVREVERTDETCVLELWVKDTGKGIAEKDHERIFGEFVSLSSDSELAGAGMGLGLAICKKIVTTLGGDISLDSELGVGSQFTIELSLMLSEEGPVPVSIPNARETEVKESILVVDDNAIVRDVISEMLSSIGYNVEIATGGEAGVLQADRKPFDLILMDISMPDVDGITAAKRIADGAGASAETPIVCLTAHAAEKDRERFFKAGMRDILMKPVKLPDLAAAVRNHIDTNSATPSERSLSPIDVDVVHEMMKRTPEPKKADRIRQIADYLIDDGKNLEAAVKVGNVQHAADMAHKLAGTSQIVGAKELSGICHLIEDIGRGDQSSMDMADQLLPLKDALSDACKALREYRVV